MGNRRELSEDELSDVDLAADSTYVADSTMSVFVVPPVLISRLKQI